MPADEINAWLLERAGSFLPDLSTSFTLAFSRWNHSDSFRKPQLETEETKAVHKLISKDFRSM